MKVNYVTMVTDPWHAVCNFVNVQLSNFLSSYFNKAKLYLETKSV